MAYDTDSNQTGLSHNQLDQMLQNSAAYRSLAPDKKADITDSMSKVFDYLSNGPGAPARAMAPNLDQLRQGSGNQPSGQPQQPQYETAQSPAQPAQGQQGGGVVSQAAGATAAMLGAVNFPGFVASLVQGTFQAIVDASIQQMEAYANLLQEVAKTVDSFMSDNITDDMARDHLADNYGDIFQRDVSTGQPNLVVDPNTVQSGGLPSFLQDLGFDSPMDIDEQAVDNVIVPQTRHNLAELRHQTLSTMVMMGINRVVVDDGEINAKLIFHVDAAETMTFNFDEQKPTNWNLAGKIGRNPFSANGILVNTTNINAQTDLNVRADLTGEVKIRFRSETFPLERFADSAAIQLINVHSRVPEQRKQPATTETEDSAENAGESLAAPQSIGSGQEFIPAGVGVNCDPWAPRKH